MSIRQLLQQLAQNIRWTWTPAASALFARIHPALWESSNHNPLAVLHAATEADLQRAFSDPEALASLESQVEQLHAYLGRAHTWLHENAPDLRRGLVAYFCAEFGMHESLPLYSGGLGVLAGDHIKTASDLGIPFVGIGLKYPEGYFQQSIDADGMQNEAFPGTNWTTIPAHLVARGGKPICVDVPLADRTIYAHVWKMQVGRSTLYLLDTNVAENNAEDRGIGGRLYSGGSETRIRQEIVLGIGGVRLLRALGLDPTVYHLNEGHCAFAAFELMRERRVMGDSYEQALDWIRPRMLFTTHTPVPAGHDRFAPDLVQVMLWRQQQAIGVDWHTFLGLGRVNPWDMNETFCMTVLALKTTGQCNAVSRLHGEVSREMWADLWPNWNVNDIPIGYVTNGIHAETFMHPMLRDMLDTRFGARWQHALHSNSEWAQLISEISDQEIVQMKRMLKRQMFESFRARLHAMRDKFGPDVDWSMGALANWRTDTLTIGFARRFATYKRGDMFFADMERAIAMLTDADRPVQLVFAGKAHPKDMPGKEMIQRVVKAARNPRIQGRVIFLENYDMSIARAMISGVDVWLNTPRRPREASGTSGQKVNMHAGVNVSILDGWWAEGYNGQNGFAIGDEIVPHDPAEHDHRDTAFLWEVMDNAVIPEYYAESVGGTSEAWVRRMRASMTTLPAQFSTRRMLADYVKQYYLPMHQYAASQR
jgi:starch phosphorylase